MEYSVIKVNCNWYQNTKLLIRHMSRQQKTDDGVGCHQPRLKTQHTFTLFNYNKNSRPSSAVTCNKIQSFRYSQALFWSN
jgi:hypothetical protein